MFTRDSRRHLRKLPQPDRLILGFGRYLGGCQALGAPSEGCLSFDKDGLRFDDFPLEAAAIRSVCVSGGWTSNTNVGAVISFGIVGIAISDTVYRTEMTVYLKSSESASFIVQGTFDVRARLEPLLQELGVSVRTSLDSRHANGREKR